MTKSIISVVLIFLLLGGCQKEGVDEDGGYYNEKTGRYQYVWPPKKAPTSVKRPRDGMVQAVAGIVIKVDSPRSVWVRIRERQKYMILAHPLTNLNRNDKTKELRFLLDHVSPITAVPKGVSKADWERWVTHRMEKAILTKPVRILFRYEEKSGQFRGELFKKVVVAGRPVEENVNQWMVAEGLSLYMLELVPPVIDKPYILAQKSARKKKNGLWGYSK